MYLPCSLQYLIHLNCSLDIAHRAGVVKGGSYCSKLLHFHHSSLLLSISNVDFSVLLLLLPALANTFRRSVLGCVLVASNGELRKCGLVDRWGQSGSEVDQGLEQGVPVLGADLEQFDFFPCRPVESLKAGSGMIKVVIYSFLSTVSTVFMRTSLH